MFLKKELGNTACFIPHLSYIFISVPFFCTMFSISSSVCWFLHLQGLASRETCHDCRHGSTVVHNFSMSWRQCKRSKMNSQTDRACLKQTVHDRLGNKWDGSDSEKIWEPSFFPILKSWNPQRQSSVQWVTGINLKAWDSSKSKTTPNNKFSMGGSYLKRISYNKPKWGIEGIESCWVYQNKT